MFKNHDWIITVFMLLLLVIGSTTIYSTTHLTEPYLIIKHIGIVIACLFVYFAIYLVDYSWLKEPKILALIYIFIIILLLIAKFIGIETAGTNRWIQLGPLNLQPAEFVKILVIVLTASIIGKHVNRQHILQYLKNVVISLGAILPLIVLVVLQPSLGNSIIAFAIWTWLILLFYPKPKTLLILAFGFILSGVIAYFVMATSQFYLILIIPILILILKKITTINLLAIGFASLIGLAFIPTVDLGWENLLQDYQKTRIESFLNPQSDVMGAGWQVRQSEIAIGSGRLLGKGFMQGTQASLGILPYSHTDFIFAAYAEQFGFVGSIILMAILFGLPVRLFRLTKDIKSDYDKCIIYGTGIFLFIHIVINIGMNLGKLPVTGIPLPFLSYGGSSLLSFSIAFGLVQNVLKYNKNINNYEKIIPV